MKPFIVTHDESVCRMEGRRIEEDEAYADAWQGETTHRYLVWADSHLGAALKVQAHKKEIGRILPEQYMVHGLRSRAQRDIMWLSDGMGTDEDQADLETFENMFCNGVVVKL